MRNVLFSLSAALLSACFASSAIAAAQIATVDVDHIMLHARAAAEARAHIGEVRKLLEKGFADLQKAWEKAPQKDRDPVLAEGAQALRQQMQLEERAAHGVVNNLLLEVVREWRANNKATMVIAKQNLLDADESMDITDAVLKMMDTRKVTFPQLPKIDIKNPGEKPEEQATPAQAGKNGARGAVRAPVQQRQQRSSPAAPRR